MVLLSHAVNHIKIETFLRGIDIVGHFTARRHYGHGAL